MKLYRSLLAALALTSGLEAARAGAPGVEELLLDPPLSGVATLALAKDQPRRLVVARPDGLQILSGFGRRGSPPDEVMLELPRRKRRLFAWCVAGPPGGPERLFVLTDGGAVDVLEPTPNETPDALEGTPRRVLEKSAVNLPDGLYHLQFARDLNGDGLLDLIVPRLDGLELHFGRGDGFVPGPTVRHRVILDVDVDEPDDGSPRIRQSIRIPDFEVADQNGDGHPDLVFRDSDEVQFFWSSRDGRLPDEPTFSLDLEEIRSLLPKASRDLIDTSNLLKALESQVSHLSVDFDGDGVFDLLLRRGSKVSIYRGGALGVDRSRATQVLKTSGNLLTAFALDDDGDGRDDLCLLQVADVSLAKVLLWLVAGGDLTLDLFVYAQEEELRFSRKPTTRRTLQVAIPSVARLVSGFEERIEGLGAELKRIPVLGDLDGDGARDDLVRIAGDRTVELYLDAWDATEDRKADGAAAWFDVLRRFDARADPSGRLESELAELVDWIPLPGRDLAAALEDRTPDAVLDLPMPENGASAERSLFVLDLDGDRREDVLLATQQSESDPLGLVWLRGLWGG